MIRYERTVMNRWVGVTILAVVVLGGVLTYQGFFFQTGSQFYRTCWERANATEGAQPKSPEQAAEWASCQRTAEVAFLQVEISDGMSPVQAGGNGDS